jgi:hypothetical protein
LQSEHDQLTAVFHEQCASLAASGAARFLVGGFGQTAWPVDVETDLAVVIEQLPSVILSLCASEPFELAFYEQGLERYLNGRRQGQHVVLECLSLSPAWAPDPQVETVLASEALQMFELLRDNYLRAVESQCASTLSDPVFLRWRRRFSDPGEAIRNDVDSAGQG